MDVAIHVLQFSRQTSGRDKLYRFVQYTARFLAWYWATSRADPTLVEKCRIIENTFSLVRKALRLGNSIELFQSALHYTRLHDAVLRRCLIVNRLSLASYLLVDHAIWATQLGLVTANLSKLGRVAAWLWLTSLIAGLLCDAIDILRAVRAEVSKHREVDRTREMRYSLAERSLCVVSHVTANRPLLVDCIKNVTDIFLPCMTLGYINSSDGLYGLMGMISSYMAILTIWDPALKFSP